MFSIFNKKKQETDFYAENADKCTHNMELIKEPTFLGVRIFRKCKDCNYKTEH